MYRLGESCCPRVAWCVHPPCNVGKLVLSVDKDTYEQLGLVGKPSRFQKQHRFCKFSDIHVNVHVHEVMVRPSKSAIPGQHLFRAC